MTKQSKEQRERYKTAGRRLSEVDHVVNAQERKERRRRDIMSILVGLCCMTFVLAECSLSVRYQNEVRIRPWLFVLGIFLVGKGVIGSR